MNNLQYENTTQLIDYPVKGLPISTIKVSSFCWVSKVDSEYLYVSNSSGIVGKAPSGEVNTVCFFSGLIHGMYVATEQLPVFEVGEYHIHRTCVYGDTSKNTTIVLLDGSTIPLNSSTVLVEGTNCSIVGNTEVSAISKVDTSGYLRRIKIGNDIVTGKYISFYGVNLIVISGDEFTTAITDPGLACPVLFDNPGGTGVTGPAGMAGISEKEADIC